MKRYKTAIAVALLTAAGIGLWMLGAARQRSEDQRKLKFAQQLIAAGRAEEALAMIRSRRRWPEGSTQRRAWQEVSIEAFESVGDALQLGQVYYDDPSLFAGHEEASQLASRALILRGDMNSFQRLRSQWHGREELPHGWMILEADALLRQGRRAQALALLTENRLQDKWESSRHIRLALLHASEPEEAWRHLADAVRNDPQQAVARLFRAQLLEAEGRLDEARLEYVAARLAQPNNAALCDQLAEHYRRRGAYRLMLDTWLASDGDGRSDFIDLKTEFWSRVALPLAESSRPPPAHGPLEGLVRLTRSLPPEQFWDESRVADYHSAYRAARHRPEVRWLRLLELLRTGDEPMARQQLRTTEFAPWETALRRSLLMTLNLRLDGELDPQSELRADAPLRMDAHPLVDQLNSLQARSTAPDAVLRSLLAGEHGVALVLMANGWTRAAVLLDGAHSLPAGAPQWAAYGMTQAHRLVDGPQLAVAYARRQPSSPPLDLLIGELLLEQERHDEAVAQWAPLANLDGAVGQRASWLTMISLIDRQRRDEAQQWLDSHAKFGATLQGKEIRARLALLRHDVELATKIYRELRAESIEARVFLARSAYHDGDLKTAEQLTRELLEEFPADQQLLKSLAEIQRQAAQQGEQG